MTTITLDSAQLVELADLVADRLADRVCGVLPHPATVALPDRRSGSLVTAQVLASMLGVSREFVYRHADELGGQRIGNGERSRLRFDAEAALTRWSGRQRSNESQPAKAPVAARPQAVRRRARSVPAAHLLPIGGALARRTGGER